MATQRDQNSFLTGTNAEFLYELYVRYLENPKSVDPSWAGFFAGMADDPKAVLDEIRGASWGNARTAIITPEVIEERSRNIEAVARAIAPDGAIDADSVRAATLDSIRALMLIRTYRVRGHLAAQLDPLGLEPPNHHAELDYKFWGFTESDLDKPIFIDYVLGFETATLRQILEALQKTYCGAIGVQFMHIQDPAQKGWIQERIEGVDFRRGITSDVKREIYHQLVEAECFERFLDKKYTGTKRFGLEGGESLIPALEAILRRGAELGVQEVVLGMPHRGRLNVLANIMGKPFSAIVSEFQGNSASPEDVQGSGDVKYHLGTSSDREFGGLKVHLSLTANPSHLEAVDPVVVGKVRAKQRQRGDTDRKQVMALLMHGDAAFCGQGLVAETLALAELRGYRTGGTVHVIVNNQIGFTTAPAYSRFTPYPSDVALAVQAPIFHVNGDDPEAVAHISRVATEFRMRFNRDVVLDLFCYRRHGHNETDEPAFTQPIMYRRIAEQPTTRQVYARRLAEEQVATPAELEQAVADRMAELEASFEGAGGYKANKADWLEGAWRGLEVASGEDRRGETEISTELFREVGLALTRVPDGFNLNRKILRQLETKRQAIETGEGIDWATAEALAFGSLLVEGVPVRFSGQDVGRGTFSHRHAVLVDQTDERRYLPLENIRPGQAALEIIDSPLAEASVLGFEYGYSLAEPHALVLWEAQFGDFANGAQVIIDQFIASAESKWLRMSGLVMLLPHGFEGQGPEHSSARLERYLQLCAEDNMQVVNCTTAANYFHVLRRQVKRNFRKPLIIMTPKSLLRAKQVFSTVGDFTTGSSFHRVLADHRVSAPAEKVRRVVLSSGKVYYDLEAERDKRGIEDVALVRLEQLHPFPRKSLGAELAKYANAEVVWCQEEPKNQGAWSFVEGRIEAVLGELGHATRRPRYVGRIEAAAPATGLLKRHNREQADLVDQALRPN